MSLIQLKSTNNIKGETHHKNCKLDMNTTKYYIDYVKDGMYFILVRRRDEAILFSNELLDNVINEAKSRNIKGCDCVIL